MKKQLFVLVLFFLISVSVPVKAQDAAYEALKNDFTAALQTKDESQIAIAFLAIKLDPPAYVYIDENYPAVGSAFRLTEMSLQASKVLADYRKGFPDEGQQVEVISVLPLLTPQGLKKQNDATLYPNQDRRANQEITRSMPNENKVDNDVMVQNNPNQEAVSNQDMIKRRIGQVR